MLAAWVVKSARESRIMTRRMTIDQLCGDTP
jgi:hypothetical protein